MQYYGLNGHKNLALIRRLYFPGRLEHLDKNSKQDICFKSIFIYLNLRHVPVLLILPQSRDAARFNHGHNIFDKGNPTWLAKKKNGWIYAGFSQRFICEIRKLIKNTTVGV